MVRGNIHRLSGLLIGAELRGLSSEPGCPLIVGGAGHLYECYRIAVEHLFGVDRVLEIPASARRMAVWKGQHLMLFIKGNR
jgi:2-keto-3-deoxy-galactonokinase